MLEKYDKQKIAGCFGFGCLVVVVLFALGGVGAYFGVTSALKAAAYKYTDDSSRELKVDFTVEESVDVDSRIRRFTDAVNQGEEAEPLALSARDANILINSSLDPLLIEMRERVRLKFEDGKILSELSLPLDRLGVKDLRGRYFNGDAELNLTKSENNEMSLNLRSLAANGSRLPPELLSQIQERTDFVDRIMKDPRVTRLTRYLKRFEVVGEQLVIEAKDAESLRRLREQVGGQGLSL